jgi:hypothetical protein
MKVGLVEDRGTLREILDLQRQNLRARLTPEEVREQGFVTLEHSIATLETLHAAMPSAVAHQGERLVGYALAMARECRSVMPVLLPMFDVLDQLAAAGGPLAGRRWYVMGQVCVAREARGTGVLDALYTTHRAAYAGQFDLLVTEIAERNPRSIRAHARVGFREVHRYRDATDAWVVVGWDWKDP